VHIRTLRTGTTVTARKCAGDSYGEMAMANDRVLWKVEQPFGHTEGIVDIFSASVRDPYVRRLASLDMERDPDNGIEAADPPLAGKGRTLVFYFRCDVDCDGSDVYKVVGRRLRRLFAAYDPIALATDAGRVVSVEQGVRRGDGCGCSFSPVWLPDGRIEFLAGTWTYDPTDGDWPVELAVIKADGTGRRILTADGRERQALDVSKNGTKAAYEYVPEFESVIAVANADGTGARDIAHGEAPSLSPDGTRLAYDTFDKIHVVAADGTGNRVIAAGSQPVWSPDGSRIAFDSAKHRLSTVRPDGSDVRTLPTGDVYGSASWSPDSRRLAFPSEGVMVIDADGHNLTRLTRTPAWTLSWSPTGRRSRSRTPRTTSAAGARQPSSSST
jgi:WD40-like Beta Propeller Repeat